MAIRTLVRAATVRKTRRFLQQLIWVDGGTNEDDLPLAHLGKISIK
jgi:hypothetical protein